MKVGILGSGFMGRTHARAYAKMKGVEVAAISSRHLEKAETLTNEVSGRATNDNLAIINDPSIDAISNTLPTHLHAEYTTAALRAGKHVLLEKPFALTAVDCDDMIAAQKESGKVLLVAHVLRFGAAVFARRLRAERQNREAAICRGDPPLAIAWLGRLVPQPGLEWGRGA